MLPPDCTRNLLKLSVNTHAGRFKFPLLSPIPLRGQGRSCLPGCRHKKSPLDALLSLLPLARERLKSSFSARHNPSPHLHSTSHGTPFPSLSRLLTLHRVR